MCLCNNSAVEVSVYINSAPMFEVRAPGPRVPNIGPRVVSWLVIFRAAARSSRKRPALPRAVPWLVRIRVAARSPRVRPASVVVGYMACGDTAFD